MSNFLELGILLCGALTACATDVQSTHYVGVFDPDSRVPQEVFRFDIHGHSAWMSKVDYASGWVPADVADMLAGDVSKAEQGTEDDATQAGEASVSHELQAGNPFQELGPQGFAQYPRLNRLVVVMSSNPDLFFQKIAILTGAREEASATENARAQLLTRLRTERDATTHAIEEARKGTSSAGGDNDGN